MHASSKASKTKSAPKAGADGLHVIAAVLGCGAGDGRTALAPADLASAGLAPRLQAMGYAASWESVPPRSALTRTSMRQARFERVVDACRDMAKAVEGAVTSGGRFLVLGGDHSIAAGTWAGASRGLREGGELGLVWIDAHMDAHVPETSPSGNWHGMPIAHLLGHGRDELATLAGDRAAIRPANLCLVGVRSYEAEEAALLSKLGVRAIGMDEVRRRGLPAVMEEALAIARRGTAGFGISLDVDSIDPDDAPGVGTRVAGGLRGRDLLGAIGGIARFRDFIGLEVVEYNPALDQGQRTRALVGDLITHAFWREGDEDGVATGAKVARAARPGLRVAEPSAS